MSLSMRLNLAYGKTGYSIELSDQYHVDVIEPNGLKVLVIRALQ